MPLSFPIFSLSALSLTSAALAIGVIAWRASFGVCKSKRRMDGKTVIITGANTGIGKETALDLANRGARVIVACRDEKKATIAVDDIKKRTNSQNVIFKKLDLASLASVRQFSEEILQEEEHINVLINNAGVMIPPYMLTEDGFELQFGVNHLGHFLLTNLLLDRIKQSTPSRIINVSALAHVHANLDFDDMMWEKKGFKIWSSYAHSKLANIMFTRELAKQLEGTGVSTYSLHPGVIRTELLRNVPWWLSIVLMVSHN